MKMALATALHHSAQRVEVPREVEDQGPQERILQRTVEHFVDLDSMAQILDAPVPQLVEQLAGVLVLVDELVKKHEQEEEEEVRRWCRTPVNQLTPLQRKKASEHISKRKRKKRRKRKVPQGALLRRLPGARAVRPWKSGHIPAPCLWQSLRCWRRTGMLGYFFYARRIWQSLVCLSCPWYACFDSGYMFT